MHSGGHIRALVVGRPTLGDTMGYFPITPTQTTNRGVSGGTNRVASGGNRLQ